MKPYISICIPAYKHAFFFKRLLDSIAVQTYKNFEVIVTDDSPDDDVRKICDNFKNLMPVKYFKNLLNLNTPENWNEALRKAKGEWIKLMHDDDWFSDKDSLYQFAAATKEHNEKQFIFSAYTNVYEESGKKKNMFLSSFWKSQLTKEPNILIADNVIGPPSVTLHKNNQKFWYDKQMKYVVDIDFYLQSLQDNDFLYINQSLINVGIHQEQVTKYTFGVAEVQLKESLLLLEKTGTTSFRNIIVFDGWWRLIRNFSIQDAESLRSTGYKGNLPFPLLKIISFQKNIPKTLLRTGVFSKILMSLCYLKYFTKNKKNSHE